MAKKIEKKAVSGAKISPKNKKTIKKTIANKEVIKQAAKPTVRAGKTAKPTAKNTVKAAAKKSQPAKITKTKTQVVKINLERSNMKARLSNLKAKEMEAQIDDAADEAIEEIKEIAAEKKDDIGRIVFQKTERVQSDGEKAVIMWTGVSFFMIVILAIWAFNLKTTFDTNAITNDGFDNTAKIRELSARLRADLQATKAEMEAINNGSVNMSTSTERNDLFGPISTSTAARIQADKAAAASSSPVTGMPADDIGNNPETVPPVNPADMPVNNGQIPELQ